MIHPTLSASQYLMRAVRRLVFMGLLAWAMIGLELRSESTETAYYDLASGNAAVTLKQFVEISGEQVIYLVNKVRGVRTNRVFGEYASEEALDIMLAGSGLVYFLDKTSGAITINRDQDSSTQLLSETRNDQGERIVRLSSFSVDADAYRGYVASATLIGGKTAQKILNVPQTVNVVTRDLIDDLGAASPMDALSRLVPGLSPVSTPASSAGGAYIRGFRAQNWSVDGATMRSLNGLTTFNVDALEVIKGPASVTFGAFAAYGGYVNLLPKYANRNHKNKIQVDVGTDRFYSGMIDVGGMVGTEGNLQYRLVLGALSYDRAGWVHDYERASTIAPSFAYDFSDTSRVRVRFALTETDSRSSTTALDINGNVLRDFASNPDDDEYRNQEDGQSMQMVWESELNDEWSMKMNLFGALGSIDWHANNLRSSTTLAQDYLISPYSRDYHWKNFFVDFSVVYKNEEIGNTGISYQAVGAVSMDHWDNTYTLWDTTQYSPWNTRRIDPSNPDYSVLPRTPGRGELVYPTRYILYNIEWLGGAVLENVCGFFDDRLLLSAAVRFNYDNRSNHTIWRTPRTNEPGGTYEGDPIPTNINEKVTKRFGLVYKPTDKVSVYLGSTEAFLAVGAIFKADGSRLSPETGKNDEVGVKLDMFEALGGNFSLTGALFKIKVVNKWRGDPDNTGFFLQDGAQESQGVDLQVTYTSEKLSAILGYFNADGPTDVLTGERAVIVPQTTWNFWAKYSVTDRLSIGGGMKHMGDTLSNDRRFKTDPYTTGDLFATYQMPVSNGMMLYRVGVSNITDDIAAFRMNGASTVWREEGRRIKVSASYTW